MDIIMSSLSPEVKSVTGPTCESTDRQNHALYIIAIDFIYSTLWVSVTAKRQCVFFLSCKKICNV